ncbi:hypothetical protein JJB99_00930 [Bradyrhizobium diazoefficiens]|uniref:hypothetical protein n=1 Tax=Bradyrhizobium diazoefficiens TaxID=1355477 RepID=UPI00190DE32A|nr:hypothetical protein [Bradyrhizobium diazoefficiens]QQO14793.1 hypothetical protein JJB99_00930 [Bradyrhizobium diazoefficiens]
MADRSDIPKKIKHLTLVWARDVGDSTSTSTSKSPKGTSKAPKAPTNAAPSVPTAPAELENADLFETLPDGYFDDDFADLPDDYFETLNDVDSKEIEKARLRFKDIDNTEELSHAFLFGEYDWWCFPELHDELRRACSGSGPLSRRLARTAGFEFIVGCAETVAFRGDGPLSTPLKFTSKYAEEPTWDEEVITLNEPYRQDALELGGCLSFMMH